MEDRIDRERDFKEEEYENDYEGEEFEEDEDFEGSLREESSRRGYEDYPIAEEPSGSNFDSRRYEQEEEEYEEI